MRLSFVSNVGAVAFALTLLAAPLASAGERMERFDRDPGWEGRNNRSTHFEPRAIRQDFGFSPTRHAGGQTPGEIGGLITPAGEPAFYAKAIPDRTFETKLSASGTLACGEGGVHVLLGFFNSGSVNEWRTPNSIALRIQGRGDVFYAYVEYATQRWRAGGDSPRSFAQVRNPETGRGEFKGFAGHGAIHKWSLAYDPAGNEGRGVVTATIDDETAICHLDEGHKADGATFNRFGVLNVVKSADSPGELWLDDIAINGEARETFDRDPRWEGVGNRRAYRSPIVRPRFDFGFSPTQFAGGKAPGELGGQVFRGDCREAERMASYGDRVGPLSLNRPLKASGKITLRRAVSDSTVLFGFYNSQTSMKVNSAQNSGFPDGILGFAVEGPSRDGFFVYPVYRVGGQQSYADGPDRPKIEPDGKTHDWTLNYTPANAGGGGRISVTLDGRSAHLDLSPADRISEATFDRFGLVTTWIDGNGQSIYFDDLTYTASEDSR